jgi:hypothetical protein
MQYRVHEWDIYPDGDWNKFRVPEDGFVIGSEFRGGNRIVVAVAIPTEMKQCIAETQSGEQCQNDALDNHAVCGTHKDKYERR